MDQKKSVEEIRSEVWAASEAMIRREAAGEFEEACRFYSNDAVLQGANLPLMRGREEILRGYRDFFVSLLEMGARPSEVVAGASGDVAFEYGTNRMVFDTPEGPSEVVGKYSRGWKKDGGEWRVALQTYIPDGP
jgi:ketosteroid isomerase-like protein